MGWSSNDGLRALEMMKKRASCRSFEDREIPKELLDGIIEAGLHAASGGNLQPLSVILINDKDENKKIAGVCGSQKFMEQAPVNLLFVIDWHKMGVFAENEDAPFTCDDSYMHFVIALEDAMCMAQTIETAAHLCGLGSCYVGTVNHVGQELAKMYALPKRTYPVILLSLGYPSGPLPVRKKLDRGIMVFENKYPELTKEFIVEKYREKYGDQSLKLPSSEPHRSEMLAAFKKALLTTYPVEKTERILAEAEKQGRINETQRRFGLHYHAQEIREDGAEIIKMMAAQGLTPFKSRPES